MRDPLDIMDNIKNTLNSDKTIYDVIKTLNSSKQYLCIDKRFCWVEEKFDDEILGKQRKIITKKYGNPTDLYNELRRIFFNEIDLPEYDKTKN